MPDPQWWRNFSKSFAHGVNPISGIGEAEEEGMKNMKPPRIKPPGTEFAMDRAREAGDTTTAAALSGVRPKPKRTGGYGGKVFQE